MSDPIGTPAPIAQTTQIAQTVASSVDSIKTAVSSLGETLSVFKLALPGVQEKLEELSKFTEKNTVNVNNFGSAIPGVTQDIAAMSRALGFVTTSLFDVSGHFSEFKKSAGEASMGMASFAEQASFADNAIKSLSKIPGISAFDISSDITGKIAKIVENLGSGISVAQGFKNSIVSMASASGDMNDVYSNTESAVETIDKRAAGMLDTTNLISQQTGIGLREVQQFYMEMKKAMPGGTEDSIAVDNIGNRVHALTAMLRTAAGTGQSASTILAFQRQQYDNLNVSAEESLKLFSMMATASSELNMRFDDMKSFTESTSDAFSYFGNKSQEALGESAINVLGKYSQALRDVGLSAKQSAEMSKDMIHSISTMSRGTKAFLSARSGGPGGLRGSFQIDQMISENKISEVNDMMRENLMKQLGGKIVSRKEATESDAGAAQYQKQLSLVMSGAFGNSFGGNEQKAQRYLDMLATNKIGEAGQLLTATESMSKVQEVGVKRQESQINLLGEMKRIAESQLLVGSLQTEIMFRGFFGAAGSGPLANYLKDLRTSTESAAVMSEKDKYLETDTAAAKISMENISEARSAVSESLKSFELGSILKPDSGSKYPTPTRPTVFAELPESKGAKDSVWSPLTKVIGDLDKTVSKLSKSESLKEGKPNEPLQVSVTHKTLCEHCLKEQIEKIAGKIVDQKAGAAASGGVIEK